jgi:ribosome-associated toxin RatA of RatAB toxin-antitoxin module
MSIRPAIVVAVFVASTVVGFAAAADGPLVSVRDNDEGGYQIAARFVVPQSRATVRAVLTDYDNIPRFMPDVRTSRVVERQEGSVRVEQEAVSRLLMFSKRIHLVLDIEEGADVIRFRDRCNESFESYEGAWTLKDLAGGTEVTYELSARPAFSVPGMVIRKLLNRDATVMIDRLRKEISARETAQSR